MDSILITSHRLNHFKKQQHGLNPIILHGFNHIASHGHTHITLNGLNHITSHGLNPLTYLQCNFKTTAVNKTLIIIQRR